ncbi:MAG TPA: M3 family metallopeptidase [Anaerolineales bacterium]|nr:M3 family metallopeptidase [Anaerolineales bacterium]
MQDDFIAIPGETAGQYHFDFGRNFFATPEVEKTARSNYYAGLSELESLKGKVADSSDNLLRALRLSDKVLVEFIRHYTYLYLRYAVNTSDEASRRESSEIEAEFSKRTAFLQHELISLDEQVLDRFVRQQPLLEPYLFAIESIRRYQPHTLTLKEEEALRITAPLHSEWQYELYQRLLGSTQFSTVKVRDGELDVRKERAVISTHPDPAIREAGFKKLYAAYASQRELYAFALIHLVRARNRLARLHHFEDAPEEAFFKSYWSKTEVLGLLQRIGELSDVYKRYQRLRADYAKKQLGYADASVWDVAAISSHEEVLRFTIEQASKIIREALSPLGSEYGYELALLLDPANGRMDIVSGDDRKSGGFSKGFPGVTTVFFSGGFTGYYNDMRVLTHESTHAVHRQLMSNNQVLPTYAEGPHYLFESFAIFNELLLPDYLYQHETNGSKRRYFLEQFFEGKGMKLFSVAQEAAVELAIYEGVKQGKIEAADDLDALTKHIGERYSIWSAKHDELKMQWITSTLFYEDPLYDINYVYGSLLALKYYEMYTHNPEQFVPRYVRLMKNGFDASPEVLLKMYLDIDLRDPRLITDAILLLENKVNLLEEEYSK